jgi:hypothetical protein
MPSLSNHAAQVHKGLLPLSGWSLGVRAAEKLLAVGRTSILYSNAASGQLPAVRH